MADIKAFLQPPVLGEEKDVLVSKRFRDEDGKPVPFTIRVIDQETNGRLLKRATKRTKMDGQIVEELDSDRYGKLLVDACVVFPNFKSVEVCEHYKTTDPLEVPGRMLNVGEYNRLVREIKIFNELTDDDNEFAQLKEEAKN